MFSLIGTLGLGGLNIFGEIKNVSPYFKKIACFQPVLKKIPLIKYSKQPMKNVNTLPFWRVGRGLLEYFMYIIIKHFYKKPTSRNTSEKLKRQKKKSREKAFCSSSYPYVYIYI